MVHIKFRYMDDYSGGRWSYQECIVSSVEECIELYGLNECIYEIISVEEVKENE